MGKARMIYYENQQTAEKGQAKGTIDLSQATSVEQVQYCCVVVTTHVVPRTAQRPSKESLFSLSTPLLVISSCKLLRSWKWTNGLLLSARRWLWCLTLISPLDQVFATQPAAAAPAPATTPATPAAPAQDSYDPMQFPSTVAAPAPDTPQALPYLFGKLSRDQAENILKINGLSDGLFLVRESASKP